MTTSQSHSDPSDEQMFVNEAIIRHEEYLNEPDIRARVRHLQRETLARQGAHEVGINEAFCPDVCTSLAMGMPTPHWHLYMTGVRTHDD